MKKKTAPAKITFVNNKGHEIHLSGSMKLSELVKMGVVNFDIVPEGTPLKDNWYRENKSP